jgi:multimeric flavodoxin WrbA
MKVILLSGSPQKNGNTVQVLEKCAESIRTAGLEAEVLSLAGMELRSCKGCWACHKSCVGRCVIDDGLNSILPKIKEADGLIIGAPVYYGTARSELMSAMQRISAVASGDGRWLTNKVGGPIAIARRGGATASLNEMLMAYYIDEMIVPGAGYWTIVFGREPGSALEDIEGINTVQNFGKKVAWLIKKIHA